MTIMKAAIFEQTGDPDKVLHVRDTPVPQPARGQVRVRMLAVPINPSDLMYIAGQYGKQPRLPATPGFEGVGVVEASGGGLLARSRLGKRVAVLNAAGGNWAEQVVVSARTVVPMPATISDDQAAAFFVNPATTVVMIQQVLKVPVGAWVLQSAAGSALGRMVIRLAKHQGFRTINIVRRREQVEELRRAGGDAVICSSDESVPDRVLQITDGAGVPFAIDAVGGATTALVARSLGHGGRMLVYGTLAMEPMTLDTRVLMVGRKQIEGFWLSEWVREQGVLTMLRLFRSVKRFMAAGILTTQIGRTFPLDQVREAVQEAAQVGRHGKVLLRIAGR
jgi:NADPH:quinone reductase-like Zn-dependent oxidoreductase